jgi:hypothetical protein
MAFLEDEKNQSLRLAVSPAPKLPSNWWSEAEAASKSADAPKFMDAADFDAQMAAQDRQAQKEANAAVEVERSLPGEVGASLVRGGLGIAKLVPQVAKIVGSDVAGPIVKGITGRDLAKDAFTPMIEGLEATAESPTWKPSKEAGGAPIDLERIVSNPGEVIGQITSQITNPRFWASQLPEGALSMVPAIVGAWAPRAAAYAGKLGTALEVANAAGKTAEATAIAAKIDRLSKIGMYGASMAMEAGQGEEKVREYEEKTGEKISWGSRVASILGTGIVAGGLEAFSLGRVLPSALLGRKAASPLAVIENVLNGKGGREIVNKVLAGVATEGLTEGAQSIVENAFPRGFFDKNQKLLEGVVESMLIGAALGGLGGGAESVGVHREAGAFARESGQFSQEFQETAARIQDAIKKAQDEYYSQFKPILPEKPSEPALVPGVERPGPQPAELTPEEQQQAIFGGELGQIAEGQPTLAAAVDALAPLVGSTERAERFYDLYQQGDAATALQEFPEHSTLATEQQKQAAITPAERELPPAFTGRARPSTPAPMGVTGMEAATRATTPASGAAEPSTPGLPPSPGTAALAPTLPPAPMGVTGGMAHDLATRRGEETGAALAEEALAPLRDQAALRDRVLDQTGGVIPQARLRTMAVREIEGRLARGEEVDPDILARFPTLAKKYGVVPAVAPAPEVTAPAVPAEGLDVEDWREGAPPLANEPSGEVIAPPEASDASTEVVQGEEKDTEITWDTIIQPGRRIVLNDGTILTIEPEEPSDLPPKGPAPKPQVLGTGAQITLADGSIVTIREDQAPYGKQRTVRVRDADGNIQVIDLSRIRGYLDEGGNEVQIPKHLRPSIPPALTGKKAGPVAGAKPVAPRGVGLHPGITGKPAKSTPAPTITPAPNVTPTASGEVAPESQAGPTPKVTPKWHDLDAETIRSLKEHGLQDIDEAARYDLLPYDLADKVNEAIARREAPRREKFEKDRAKIVQALAKELGAVNEATKTITWYGKNKTHSAAAKWLKNLDIAYIHGGHDIAKAINGAALADFTLRDRFAAIARKALGLPPAKPLPTAITGKKAGPVAQAKPVAKHPGLPKGITGKQTTPEAKPEAPAQFKVGDTVHAKPSSKVPSFMSGGRKIAIIRSSDGWIQLSGHPEWFSPNSFYPLEEEAPIKFQAGDMVMPKPGVMDSIKEPVKVWRTRENEDGTQTIKIEGSSRNLSFNASNFDLVKKAVTDTEKAAQEDAQSPTVIKPLEINTIILAEKFLPKIAEALNLRQIGTQSQIKIADLIKIVQDNYDIPQEKLQSVRKQIEEAFELAIVQQARQVDVSYDIVEKGLEAMEALYALQPVLTARTSTTIKNQAYSTPAPLAYLMGKVAGISLNTWVYEPTAGNGMLVIGANPQKVVANEIDPLRSGHLQSQGFDVSMKDAQSLVGKEGGPQENSVDVMVANPPFGILDSPVEFDGYKITKLEHAIVLDALQAMDDEGRAVFIIGGHSFATPLGGTMDKLTNADRVFFNYLYSHYNVTHHINVDGKVYERMGTKFPIRLITIQGRKVQPDKAAAPYKAEQIEVAKSFKDVYLLLQGEIDAYSGVMAPGVSQGQQAGPGRPGGVSPAPSGETRPGTMGVPGSLEGEGSQAGQEGGETGGGRRGASVPGQPGARSGGSVYTGGRGPGGANRPNQSSTGGQPGGRPGVSSQSHSGIQTESPGPVSPGPGTRSSQSSAGTEGAEGSQSGRVSTQPLGPGNRITLPDGSTVTIKESQAPYAFREEQASYGEQTIEVVDADGNVRRILISQIQGVVDESGKETKLSAEDRQNLRVFQKGQQVQVGPLLGQITKIRGRGERMEITVQGPESTVTVKPEDITKILPLEEPQAPPKQEEKPKEEPTPAPEPAEGTNLQIPYKPLSQGRSMSTVAPRYMAEAIQNYLKDLEGEIGNLDEFVRDRLDYKTQGDLFKVLGAEQIETVALAIDAIERGSGGFVVGHQTGVGKGRVVAAVMRYAHKQGLIPIFLTQNDGLFSDMYRDMVNITGAKDFQEGLKALEINPLIVASDANRARITDKSGNTIRNLDRNAIQEATSGRDLPQGYNAIFTTYYQLNSRQSTPKKELLERLASRSIVILDESHMGAGRDSNTGIFLRGHITPQARGVVYSSATYAKRADNMGLYHRTELGNLNVDLDTIIDNVERGGVPMQEWIAHQWALSGQMIRNELSFAGIDIPVEIDTENATRDYQRSDDLTQGLRAILDFSKAFGDWVSDLNDEFQEDGQQVDPHFNGRISNTGFASVMHNKISQLLFCLRADATIKEALAALKQGKKAVIGCYNTMEAFVKNMLEEGTIALGDELNMNFAQVLRKAADGTLVYTIDHGTGQPKEKVYIRPEQLSARLRAQWDALVNLLENTTTDVPAMPIDYIAKALIKEGYKVGEITGRQFVLDWEQEGNILKQRGSREISDKNAPVNKFNSGEYDVLIINSAGSTGISLHASEDFVDQRPRHMILTQMSNEINSVVQLLGRIHRTGTVKGVLPTYMIKISSLPGEKRFLVVLQKKLASLFANVSAKGESAYSMNVNDIINRYGDQVIAEMFADDPSLNDRLSGVLNGIVDDHHFIDADRDGRVHQILNSSRATEPGGLTKRVTGWASLQPVTVQEEVWAQIDAKYEDLVEQLKQVGEYNLESEHLDLQARTVGKSVLVAGSTQGRSELSAPTYFETIEAKVQRKPMTKAEIMNRMNANLKGQTPQEVNNEIKTQIQEEFDVWIREKVALMTGAGTAQENIDRFRQGARNALQYTLNHLDTYQIGTALNYQLQNMAGVIYDIKYKPVRGSNPATPGNIKISLAVDSTMRVFKTSMAGVGVGAVRYEMSALNGWLDASPHTPSWDNRLPDQTYETRYAVTGNLLGNPLDAGQMTFFTRDDGTLATGFLMPLNFDISAHPELQRVTLSQSQAETLLRQEELITSSDGEVAVRKNSYNNTWTVEVPSSRARGGKYFLNDGLLALVRNGEFYKNRSLMIGTVSSWEDAKAIVKALYEIGAVFSTDRTTAEGIFGNSVGTGVAEQQVKFNLTPEQHAEEMRMAYGSEKAAEQVVRETARQVEIVSRKLQGIPGTGVPGVLAKYRSRIAQEYSKQRWVSLAGQKLESGNESRQIAELFQVFRSPKVEILHTIYTKGGVIVAHNAISSGAINYVRPKNIAQYLHKAKETAKRLGADKVHVLHNHPSGNPEMSLADQAMSKAFRYGIEALKKEGAGQKIDGLGDLMGEFVVIDHGKFSYLAPYPGQGHFVNYGDYRVSSELRQEPGKRVKVSNSSDLAAFISTLNYGEDKTVLVHLDSSSAINGWSVHNKAILNKPPELVKKAIRQEAQAFNATVSVIVTEDQSLVNRLLSQEIKRGGGKNPLASLVLDIINFRGQDLKGSSEFLWSLASRKAGSTAHAMWESQAAYSSAQATLDQYHRDLMAQDPGSKSLWRRFWNKDPALKASWTEMNQKAYDQVVDRFAPGERAQDKLAKAGITMPAGEQFTSTIGFWRGQEGWNHEAVLGSGIYTDQMETLDSGESFFTGATPTRVGDSLFKRVDPIRALAKARSMENKEVFRDLRLLMVANRDLELAGEAGARAPGEIKGVRPDESRAALQALETKYGADLSVLQEIGGKWNADGTFTPGEIQKWADQAILQRLLQAGVINRDLYNQIKTRNQAYIPFARLMDELDQYIKSTGGGKVIKEIKGSERAIVDPFQMLIELSAKANYAYAKNRMIRSLYQMGQASPEMGIKELKPKIIPSGMMHKDKWDPLGKSGWAMAKEIPTLKKGYAFSQLPPEPGAIPFYKDGKRTWLKLPPDLHGMMQNLLPEDLGLLMRVLKWPADVLRTGAVTTPEFGLIKNPLRDLVQAWLFNRAGFSPAKWFRDLYLTLSKDPTTVKMKAEMAAGGGFMATLAQSTVDEHITAADIEGKKKNIAYAAHPVEALRTLSAYLENLTRFSLYKQARENGLSHAEAVHEARRTTLDFRRLGAHPVARYLNMIIPFWNANVQGIDKLVTELQGPNKAKVWRRLGTLTAASIGLALLFHDDDRLKELEDWEKNYFWHIPLGKTGPIIRLPKPFEAGILFGSIPERIVEVARGDNTTGLQAAVKAAFDVLTPETIPAILRPMVELKSNYNFFLGRPIEDASLQSLPVELRSKPWTTPLAKAISAHGGNLIGLSPVKIEHFVRSFSGGLGASYYFPGADLLLRKAGILEDLPNPQQDAIERAFGVRALFAKPPAGYRAKSVGDFFENVQNATRADQGWKLLWNTGSMDKLDAFLKDNPEAMFARVARQQMAELGKIKNERTVIHLSKTLTAEQKRARMDALDERIVTLARAGNALMDPAVAEAVKMPSRKGMDFETYKKASVEFVGDAYDIIQKNLPKLVHMEEAQRQRYLIKIIRQAREDYKPLLKKPESAPKPSSPFDKPTRAEKARWQSVMGFGRIPVGGASEYRMREE